VWVRKGELLIEGKLSRASVPDPVLQMALLAQPIAKRKACVLPSAPWDAGNEPQLYLTSCPPACFFSPWGNNFRNQTWVSKGLG
jgi:hypothetical protein